MRCTTFLASLAAVTAAVVLCDRYLDIPLSRAAQKLNLHYPFWADRTADIPDMLFLAACIITLASCSCYLYLVRRGSFSRFTWFCRLTAYTVPVSYGLKFCLKFVFGRVNTRFWLKHPEAYGFDWFHGSATNSGFPSGHILVFATLAACVWRFYPRFGYPAAIVTLLLAGALIATNYHFLGDVIAGAYLGVCVEAFVSRLLDLRRGDQPDELEG